MKPQSTLNAYIEQAIRTNWERPALTNLGSVTYRYCDVARKIAKIHIAFRELGLSEGDKIAFCGRNSAELAIAMLAGITYGTVTVPILHDFTPETIHHLVCHCDAKVLFTDSSTWEALNPESMPALEGSVLISDYSLLFSRSKKLERARKNLNKLFGEEFPERFTPDDVKYVSPDPSKTALINYTSGSTGFSKGVMLSYANLWSNLQYCIDGLDFLKPGDTMLSMLPLAHMFGLMVELIHTFAKGCHIYLLTRTPSPAVLLSAFAEVRPKLVVAVPLIIEKMVKTRVFPMLDKPLMKILLHLPVVDHKLLGKVKEKLEGVFGGNMRQIIIGGAGLSKDVETFLRKIEFPYTVGYGMTECGPLICYAPWEVQRPGSCGCCVDRMELRVESPDPSVTPGILWVRGDNVMQGYYKNDEATEAVFKDGWMNTGDICQIDADGFVYIRGRDKNMILGPSGQNIYPEEIEQKLNNMPYVSESLVIDRDNKLVALVHPDYENARAQNMSDQEIADIMRQDIAQLNKEIPSYSQISDLEIHVEEFEKTPKRSIKRYLYTKK
ncbi:MAG: AMP-binding protein [Muribaculaceae bacterium]|nr:AMP-binding protein [Muribaculaceae bacterium]